MSDARKPVKELCFVIGPIGKEGSAERKHSDLLLNAVIKQVLQRAELGYLVKRADEDADPGMIGDRVVSDIINADLVVADLTDLNPNALYELGIRHSTEKPTIHVARAGTVLPFDTVTHRTIFVDLTDWHSIEQARERLANSVSAIKTPGYKVSNPITQANASFKMRKSEDPRDRVIAEMQERMSALENAVSKTPAGTEPVSTISKEMLDLAAAIAARLHDGQKNEAITLYRLMSGTDSNRAKEVMDAISGGHKLEAIRRHRSIVGGSLKEAKDFIEAIGLRKE